MISYRRSDIFERMKTNKPVLGVVININIVEDASSWRPEIIFTFMLKRELREAIENVLMSHDDFKKVEFTTNYTRQELGGYGFRGQWMESYEAAVFNVAEVIRGIENIDGVKEVKALPISEQNERSIEVYI